MEPKKYTLSLSPEYVMSWGLWEACRELLQNSIDQCAADKNCEQVFDYEGGNQDYELCIGTTNCRLEPRCLLLGMSSKRDNAKMIGQFGEGFKLALLVLTRLQYAVTIRNNGTIWKPSFEYSDEYQEHLLTVTISEDQNPKDGVFFYITDVTADDIGKINENYLRDVDDNRILYEEYLRGRVFVSGLFVCEIEGLGFGYNFSPGRIKLDRDRGMASNFEVTYAAARLWETAGKTPELYEALKRGTPDTQYVSHPSADANEYIVSQYLEEHPDAIPVCSQDEMDRVRGCKTQLVSQPLRDLLRRLHAFVFNRQGTPVERLEAFSHQFLTSLSTEAQREFDALMEDAKDWR